jgi:hypothetical protein
MLKGGKLMKKVSSILFVLLILFTIFSITAAPIYIDMASDDDDPNVIKPVIVASDDDDPNVIKPILV